jgi:cytochrome c oxidase subunit II
MFGILADSGGNFLLPQGASTIAAEIDWLKWFITWVSIIFGFGVIIVTFLIAFRFRHKPGVNDIGKGPTHSTLLEITWSVIPGIIVLLIAIWGFQGYMKFAVVPQEALEIQVEGYKWGWRFIYPNGHMEPNLHIPKDMPVRFVMRSDDVIHSLYFPHFRIKKDVVPGRYNKMWVVATETSPLAAGKDWTEPSSFKFDVDDPTTYAEGFDIYCTEYCGTSHSRMLAKVYVHPTYESYAQWLAKASDIYRIDPATGKPTPTVEIGEVLAKKNGCLQCHSIDGAAKVGPTWKNLFGHSGSFTDGQTYVADEDYIRESILYPNKHIVAGFAPGMPSYLGKLSDRDITALINYMKSISENYKGSIEELNAPLPDPKAKEGATPSAAAN